MIRDGPLACVLGLQIVSHQNLIERLADKSEQLENFWAELFGKNFSSEKFTFRKFL